jgi:hypothetical protein
MNTEKLTMAIAAKLVKCDWTVLDDGGRGMPDSIDEIKGLHEAVKEAIEEAKGTE